MSVSWIYYVIVTSPATIRHLIFVALYIALMAVLALSPPPACAADEQQAAASEKVYIIGPEDVLKITVWDHADLTKSVTVDLDGYINYKFVGMVMVEGFSMNHLGKDLAKEVYGEEGQAMQMCKAHKK